MKKGDSYSVALAVILSVVFLAILVSATPSFTVPAGTSATGSEDTLFFYNLTANVSSSSWNEGLSFSIYSNITAVNYSKVFAGPTGSGNAPSSYPWISLNSSTGILMINITFDNESGFYTLPITVLSNNTGPTQPFYFNITPVNDPPYFTDLVNSTFNSTYMANITFHAYDEENNTPFKLNISFVSCNTAIWSPRNSTNCTLFDNSSYIFNSNTGILNITFTPQHNDTGSYIINLTLTDSGNIWPPINASSSQLVNFTILNVNQPPYFTYTCNNERNATEDGAFSCYINVTDPDETNNLTFQSYVNGTNPNWFTFASTGTSSTYVNASIVNFVPTFNGTLISFTPTDFNVGNWTVTINVTDTGSPVRSAAAAFNFSVANIEDLPIMQSPGSLTIYTSNNYTSGVNAQYINATDDDLLIPDKQVYNEVLTFRSNDSRVFIQSLSTTGNKTIAQITLNGSNFTAGTSYVNLTVTDVAGKNSTGILTLDILSNHAPVWINTTSNFTLNEDSNFFLNLSANVNDSDGNPLNFSFDNMTYFPDFGIVKTTGIINFTPTDVDVGLQTLVVNVTDGIASVPQTFSFVVNNINDTPIIQKPLANGIGATINITNSNINVSEDSNASFQMQVRDDDLLILQKSFYNESLNVSYLNISGPTMDLFNFTLSSTIGNISIFQASFTPRKANVGVYQISLNVSDNSGLNDSLQFNITVTSINHAPNVSVISNQTSSVNRTFTLEVNATDIEDSPTGAKNGSLIYSLAALPGSNNFVNATNFNITGGLLNLTFNSTQAGSYHLNLTVKDSVNLSSSRDFWLFVYDFPAIISPTLGTMFNLTENVPSNLTVNVTHTVGDNLSYSFYLNSSLKYSVNKNSALPVNWSFLPGFNDETHGGLTNVTLFVSNPIYHDLNATMTWNTNISHTNAPVLFNGTIPSQQKNYDQVMSIDLSSFFSDVDHTDIFYNQTLSFNAYSNVSGTNLSAIKVSISNVSWIANFTATSEVSELFNITANDSQYTNVSGPFTVSFTTPSQTSSTNSESSSGGGGGGTSLRPVALNIIVPGPLTAKKHDKLIVPISVVNSGKVTLSGIVLRNVIARNGILRSDLLASFDQSFIDSLQPGQKKNLTLIVDVDTTDAGLYEVTLNGTATSPSYSDTAKLYINVEQGQTIQERIAFTEELIAQNPQCIELKERVDGAKQLLASGKADEAGKEVDSIIQACQEAIAQSNQLSKRVTLYDQLVNSTVIATIAAIVIGIVYYFYRRFRLQHSMSEIPQTEIQVQRFNKL